MFLLIINPIVVVVIFRINHHNLRFLLNYRLGWLRSLGPLGSSFRPIPCINDLILSIEHIRVKEGTLIRKGRILKNFAKILQKLL